MIQVYHKKLNSTWYGAAVQDEQILATYFSLKKPDLMHLLRKLPDNSPFQIVEEPNQLLTKVLEALEEVFNGKGRESYGLKIGMDHLSGYSKTVLNCTFLVPVGYVTSYGALAKIAGGSARSVGRVEASNPVPLLIPCHRVVRSNLSVGGYGYGRDVKLEILHKEKRGYEEPTELEVNDKNLSLFPTESVKQS